MQSHWPGLPCGSTPEVLTRVWLPVAQIETLQCFGSSVLSWLFSDWHAGGLHHAKVGFCRVKGKDTRWVSRGNKKGRGAGSPAKAFQTTQYAPDHKIRGA